MKFFYKKILQPGLALVMGLCFSYEANFTQALAGQDIDVYVAYSGKDKKDKRALKKAFPANLSVKFYNVDLLALADYSGKQKAIAKLEKAKVIVFVKDALHELLEGSTFKKDIVIFNSAKNGVQSEGKTLYIALKGTTLDGGLKTRNATEEDLLDSEILKATDAVVLNGSIDIHSAVALVVATLLGS